MSNGANFTIEDLTVNNLIDDPALTQVFVNWANDVSKRNDPNLSPSGFHPGKYLERGGKMILVRRKGEPVGVILVRLLTSVLDRNVRILYQDLLYSVNPKATRILLQWLIDFGRRNANHIITTIAADSNLKPRSLERLGFEKLEELYRLRV